MKVLISSCLIGKLVRYDGKSKPIQHERLYRWLKKDRIIAVCPEMLGGLPAPRAKANIVGEGHGKAVLKGNAKIMNINGENVTNSFLLGAKKTLEIIKEHNIKVAILKEYSPSCGKYSVYDSSGLKKIPGMGSTTAFLQEHGIEVFSENEIDAALYKAQSYSSYVYSYKVS